MVKASQHFRKSSDSGRFLITAPKRYAPLKDKGEFMNPKMLAYFWQQLRNKQSDLTEDIRKIQEHSSHTDKVVEIGDIAQRQQQNRLDTRQLEKLGKIRARIGKMIEEIEVNGPNSEYGFCEDTGEQIEVARLISTPWAARTVEAQQAKETGKKLYANAGGALSL